MSSLNENAHGSAGKQGGGEGGGATPPSPTPFDSRLLNRYLKDDVNGFSSTKDICFVVFIEIIPIVDSYPFCFVQFLIGLKYC